MRTPAVLPQRPLPEILGSGSFVGGTDGEGELEPGERLPPASELAGVLDVNPNTVLHAFRRLRDQGVLEFRRGRGARVSPDARSRGAVQAAVAQLVELGGSYGYTRTALAQLVEELA